MKDIDRLPLVIALNLLLLFIVTALMQAFGFNNSAIVVFVSGFIIFATLPKWYIKMVKKIARIK